MNVGLIYNYDENWIGGAYYIQNLVHAFNTLPEKNKPRLTIISGDTKAINNLKKQTQYPYFKIQEQVSYSKAEHFINRVSQKLLKKKLINKEFRGLQVVFPVFDYVENQKSKMLYWIPDFQEHYLPEFFSPEEVARRSYHQKNIAALPGAKLLVSSHAALRDYRKFYPDSQTRNFVVPFAVTHDDYSDVEIERVRVKYEIVGDYFISPNQFWAHKNHIIIVEAVKLLKNKGLNIKVLFTGNPHDWRNPQYYSDLLANVEKNNLSENILFLGFIDRKDQLCLMKNSIAVIQPSRFEGWSTVVEDAKAMNQFVIASDIDVHKEQLEVNGSFFNPDNVDQLADLLAKAITQKLTITPVDYSKNVIRFAQDFLKVFNS